MFENILLNAIGPVDTLLASSAALFMDVCDTRIWLAMSPDVSYTLFPPAPTKCSFIVTLILLDFVATHSV